MRATADLLAPALLALVLTVAVAPISGWLRTRGGRSWPGVAASAATATAILVGLGVATVLAIGRLVDLLPAYRAQFESLQADIRTGLARIGLTGDAALD